MSFQTTICRCMTYFIHYFRCKTMKFWCPSWIIDCPTWTIRLATGLPTSQALHLIHLASCPWRPVGSACCGQLKNATHFTNNFVYFSNHNTTPLSGSWKHPHKYQRKSKDFIFEGLPCLLQAVTKISTVYKFDKSLRYSRSVLAILRDETELALGSKRVKNQHYLWENLILYIYVAYARQICFITTVILFTLIMLYINN